MISPLLKAMTTKERQGNARNLILCNVFLNINKADQHNISMQDSLLLTLVLSI